MFELRRFSMEAGLLAGASLLFIGCTKDPHRPAYQLMHHMEDSFALKAQHLDDEGQGMRTPPEGTIPQGFRPYACGENDASRTAKNPLPRSKEVLARGQKLFNTYCIVCHGARGEGDGSIVPKFPRPPSLQSEKVRNWKDENIFHVISCGQNLMPSYASQVDPVERWAIIHYVRVLQRSLNPSAEDLKLIKKVN